MVQAAEGGLAVAMVIVAKALETGEGLGDASSDASHIVEQR